MNTIVKCWTRFGHTSGRKCLQWMATRHMSVEWHLMSAVCLQRSPQIVPEMNWLEKKMTDVLHTVETNRSLYCDHEMRHFEDVRRAQRMAAGDKVDEKDLDAASKQTAQDFEEYYNHLLTQFSKSPRITQSDVTNDRKSLDRCLDRHLMLVCRQRLGDTVEEWLLPQATNSGAEETMRQTAERALQQFCSSPELEVQFLGNVPSAVYSYRYPSAVTEKIGTKGAKIFTFKALCKTGVFVPNKDKCLDYEWLNRTELAARLPQTYWQTISKSLLTEGLDINEIMSRNKTFRRIVKKKFSVSQ
ncbi:unnamed protein product [Medioppia subpectinata]|uniref:Large ribosomal subunit protein mL46 n=1 Tax=Medioppia subpectinata TaxID=1979941 RepID=A0A7R9PZU8_9ACAR|nr:unnamed protein product [Medioppia subpectinata]CAG2107365.1 unnamed protein product [Medioppia subpectinata]